MAAGAIPPPLFFEQHWSSDSTGLRAALILEARRRSSNSTPLWVALAREHDLLRPLASLKRRFRNNQQRRSRA